MIFFCFIYKVVFRTVFTEGCKKAFFLAVSVSVRVNGKYINAVMVDSFRWMTEGGQCCMQEVATE